MKAIPEVTYYRTLYTSAQVSVVTLLQTPAAAASNPDFYFVSADEICPSSRAESRNTNPALNSKIFQKVKIVKVVCQNFHDGVPLQDIH